MSNLAIVPTYNEKENIVAMIDAVMALDGYDILVVDDGSPDGTAALVKDQQVKYGSDRVHLLERSGKLGLGSAYIAGFKYGLEHDYDYLYEMDADFSHDPKDLLRLRAACDAGADMTVGSRYTKGGGFVDWPRDRIFISKGGSLYVRTLTFMPIKDPTAGFICYSAKVLRAIDLDKVGLKGYAFQIEMKYVAYKLGFKIKEVPIIFKDRELGTSKMNTSIIKEAISGVIKLRCRNIKKYYSSTK